MRRFIVCLGYILDIRMAAKTIQAMAKIVISQFIKELYSQAARQMGLSELQVHAAAVNLEIFMVDSTMQPEVRPEPAITQTAKTQNLIAHYVWCLRFLEQLMG